MAGAWGRVGGVGGALLGQQLRCASTERLCARTSLRCAAWWHMPVSQTPAAIAHTSTGSDTQPGHVSSCARR